MDNFTSNISPTNSLASSGSTAIPEVVMTVQECTVIPFPPSWSPPPLAEVRTGQVGRDGDDWT